MRKWQKYIYITIMTGLTSSAISACYWQGSKYYQAKARWRNIAK